MINTHKFHKLRLSKRTWEANVLNNEVLMYIFYEIKALLLYTKALRICYIIVKIR